MQERCFVFLIALGFLLPACTKETLKELERLSLFKEKYVKASIHYCTTDPKAVKSLLKFLFIMDKSGSNSPAGGGNDPNGYKRYAPFLSFVQGHEDNDTTFYALENFSTVASIKSAFTNDKPAFEALIQQEWNPNNTTPPTPTDSGWTNYTDALIDAGTLIQKDIDKARALPDITEATYNIIFITDGVPQTGPNEFQKKSDILNAVRALTSLAKSAPEYVAAVTVGTAYYYETFDPNAKSLLEEIATEGNGKAYTFGAGQNIDFSQYAVAERKVNYKLKDIFVTNFSTLWWNDELLGDTDTDSVPDIEEKRLGSDPYLADSDKNGIHDGIELKLYGTPCKGTACEETLARAHIFCNGYQILNTTSTTYNDKDRDGLNDCEETLLKTKRDSFDSNFDWITDTLASRAGIAAIDGTNDASTDSDFDLFSAYYEIKVNTPHTIPNDRVLGLKPYHYELSQESVSNDETGKDCYRLEVTDIASFTDTDIIRIDALESSSVIENKRILRSGTKGVFNGKVSFENSEIQ